MAPFCVPPCEPRPRRYGEDHGRPRQLTGPALLRPPAPHLLDPLWRWAEREPARPLLAARDGDAFAALGAAEVRDAVREIAGGLVARGVGPGDRVVLLARTRREWVLADHAILAAGAVSVPVYDTSSPAQVARILDDCGAVLALVETSEQRQIVTDLGEALPTVTDVLAIDEDALGRLRTEGGRTSSRSTTGSPR